MSGDAPAYRLMFVSLTAIGLFANRDGSGRCFFVVFQFCTGAFMSYWFVTPLTSVCKAMQVQKKNIFKWHGSHPVG